MFFFGEKYFLPAHDDEDYIIYDTLSHILLLWDGIITIIIKIDIPRERREKKGIFYDIFSISSRWQFETFGTKAKKCNKKITLTQYVDALCILHYVTI